MCFRCAEKKKSIVHFVRWSFFNSRSYLTYMANGGVNGEFLDRAQSKGLSYIEIHFQAQGPYGPVKDDLNKTNAELSL